MKLWAGRFQKESSQEINSFNSSIAFDARLYEQDIAGSLAHCAMLAKQGIISPAEGEIISEGLTKIRDDIASGNLLFDPAAEDVHMFVEAELTKRIGECGKKLHTARSRNDQVALDMKLYLAEESVALLRKLDDLIQTIVVLAEQHQETILPGYTHLQRAQPITFGHHLLAYVHMFLRDKDRVQDARKRLLKQSPLGSCALAGTTYPIDRHSTAAELGFVAPYENSLDGVSDRDYCIEIASACSLIMLHLSRFSEEIILWSSWEFKFIEIDDAFSTGSSIMPQKRTPTLLNWFGGKQGESMATSLPYSP